MTTVELRAAVNNWAKANEPNARAISIVVEYGSQRACTVYQINIDQPSHDRGTEIVVSSGGSSGGS
jgi:hypothetical protein